MKIASSRVFDLTGHLERERRATDAALRRLAAELLAGAPAELADPIRYAIEAGGKRLRPILCVAAYRAVTGRSEGSEPSAGRAAGRDRAEAGRGAGRGRPTVPGAVRELAAAIELIHTYSLIHDDLPCMDDDDLRRGRPSTHRAHGEAAAMVAGAALIPMAAGAANRAAGRLALEPRARAALTRELCVAAGAAGMVGGQLLDLEAEARPLSLAELEAVHRRKTGALLQAALRMGGLAAGGDDEAVAALHEYGQAIGLAFQITDDVLDETGRSAELGKTVGRDRALGKATYPALMGLDGARDAARQLVDTALGALDGGGLRTPELEALAVYAVERNR